LTVAAKAKFKAKAYALAQYQEPGKIEFPRELPVAFAVCAKKCGRRQFIVDGATQVCEYCGRLMFRVEVATYALKQKKRTPLKPTRMRVTQAADVPVAPRRGSSVTTDEESHDRS